MVTGVFFSLLVFWSAGSQLWGELKCKEGKIEQSRVKLHLETEALAAHTQRFPCYHTKHEGEGCAGFHKTFLDAQASLAPTHLCPSVGNTFKFPFFQRLWSLYVKS